MREIDGDLVYQFLLDVPDLELEVDSPQFFILLNVAKNLLLAPPPQIREALKFFMIILLFTKF